uniref:Uncharacterized protein n=1 Tax=viral metagenome TaxID=1070528 RepID=A0A6H1ZUB5_9ZZZZ
MLVPENEIRVYYKRKEKIIEAWDLAIEDALVKIGMKRWASGFDLTTGIRDLAFKPQTEIQG